MAKHKPRFNACKSGKSALTDSEVAGRLLILHDVEVMAADGLLTAEQKEKTLQVLFSPLDPSRIQNGDVDFSSEKRKSIQ